MKIKRILLTGAIYIATVHNVNAQAWNLNGNTGTSSSTNFIGTTDNVSFKIRTKNSVRVTITAAGKVGIGITSPAFKLDVKSGSINTDSVYRIGGSTVISTNGTNTFFGPGIGNSITIGIQNTATGKEALKAVTIGGNNTASGYQALYATTSGSNNTAKGFHALLNNTTGEFNIAIGSQAMNDNTTGSGNVAIGTSALYNTVTTSRNTAIGHNAMLYAWNGATAWVTNNVAVGYEALRGSSNLSANGNESNTAIGNQSMYSIVSGSANTAVGISSLLSNTTGFFNTSVGAASLYYNTSGYYNTALGMNALYYTSGSYNTAVGSFAGNNSGTAPSNFSAFGNNAGYVGSGSNSIEMGNTSVSWIGGQSGWFLYSDKRIKENIQKNVPGLSFISKLNPVTYNLNIHKQNQICGIVDTNVWEGKYDIEKITQTGFIAQEVEQAAKEVAYDFNGVQAPEGNSKLYSVQYASFVVPLVKAVQELNESILSLKSENEMIKSVLTEEQKEKLNIRANISKAYLEQNAPNPFNKSTVIKYELPATFSIAYIKIYSQQGVEVKSYTISAEAKGEITVEANTLAAGIYSYTLIMDGEAMDVKQMIVTK